MLKKLEHDALTADLVAVESLLASRTEDEDPIGFFQYSSRRRDIAEQLHRLGSRPDHHAELGIFFGGGPVQGSRGINADFAGKALDDVQALITKRYSELETGGLKQAGRLPLTDRSRMLVTSVVRGSIGFVLEEASDTAEIVETPLRLVVDQISELLTSFGADDAAAFDEAAGTLDQRILVTLKQFFVRLDEQEATLRVVSGSRDVVLNRHAISLARQRVQEIGIEETLDEFVGTVFLLPESRRFELQTWAAGSVVTLTGTVSHEATAQFSGQQDLGAPAIDARKISQRPWRVIVKTKVIVERNRPPKRMFSLVRLIGEAKALDDIPIVE